MEQQPLLTRRERLGRLGDVCQAITAALQKKGFDSDFVFLTFRDLVFAECVDCGTRVPGEELYVLSQPADGEDLTVSLRRLRLGYCANPSCQSFHYQLSFHPGDKLDWNSCLTQADRITQDQADARAGRSKHWRSALIRPTAITIVGLLLILLLRQLYVGGRIPLIREPEKFRVDPAPVGDNLPR
jgi:hypothetical protein